MSVEKCMNRGTLVGKIMCGYQGWFAAPGDGSGGSWVHYGPGDKFAPGNCTIDLWPDMSELDEDEKYDTPFRNADGSTATLFSSRHPKTVDRHFKWMADYGIDGAFLQRFVGVTKSKERRQRMAPVAQNVQAGAQAHGRCWAMMYDLSGMRPGDVDTYLKPDWRGLVDEMGLLEDPNYLHHKGKPVVSVWGIGFNDNRKYTCADCMEFVQFLKSEGLTVMLGVPTNWRTQDRDTVEDPLLHEVIKSADIVSPWVVGRFGTLEEVKEHKADRLEPDIAWCRENGLDYLPVCFPGFSWYNLQKCRGRDYPFEQIPRLGGKFVWSQYAAAVDAGATMIYQAMFDEIDEGTATFKCTNEPPIGDSPFLTYEGLPTDHYLWLAGQAGQMLRGEIPISTELPTR